MLIVFASYHRNTRGGVSFKSILPRWTLQCVSSRLWRRNILKAEIHEGTTQLSTHLRLCLGRLRGGVFPKK